mgnify:CR=1 FL=1
MKLFQFLGATLFLLVFASFTYGDKPVAEGYGIGDMAADYSLKNIDDTMVSLSDFKDAKGYFVDSLWQAI